MLINELQKIGFSDKEASVYLASLELGQATILEIAKKAKIKRPTAYVIVEGFIKRGLASSFEKGKKRYFAVESPERLMSLFKIQEKEIQENEKAFKAVLPQLKEIFAMAEEKPKVRFFEGKEGIEAIREDIIKTKTQIMRELTSLDDAYDIFPPQSSDHRKQMARNIKEIKTLYTSKKGLILPKKQGPYSSVAVPFSRFPFFCDIVSYNNKTAFIAYKGKLMGVVIENESMAKTINSIFDALWEKETA